MLKFFIMYAFITLIVALIIGVAYTFPTHNFESQIGQGNTQIIEGCIGDCSSCHSLLPYEAKEILGKKFDVKNIVSIKVKMGFFEIVYKNSKGKKEKINLLFSKDKACKDLILLK